MTSWNEDAIKEFHIRRKKYAEMGYDPYLNAEFIVSLLGDKSGTVLEVGTGRGFVTTYLAKQHKVTSLDVDSEAQEFAKDLAASEGVEDKIEFLLRDINEEPFSENSYDYLFSANSFHHYEKPEQTVELMCKAAREKVVITDFNEEGFKIADMMHKNEGKGGHDSGSSPLSLAGDVMSRSGLKVEKFEKYVTIAYVGTKQA